MSDATYVRAAVKIEQFCSGALDSEIKSTVRGKAVVGGLCMAIPLWGIETIIYAICLWGTYKKISDISGVPFKDNAVRNIIGGFIVNIIVTFVICMLLDFIPVAGWISSFVVGFISLYMSAMGYVKALKMLHGEKAKSDLNIKAGFAAMQQSASEFKSDLTDTIDKISATQDKVSQVESVLDGTTPIGDVVDKAIDRMERPNAVEYQPAPNPAAASSKSIKEQILELKELLDEGLISQKDFEKKKAEILGI